MRLRRVSVDGPGLARRRRGRGFSYLDLAGRPITDEETVDRIRALAIPPAWSDVWISPDSNGHIQAVGTDDAGRRQYLYHERWRARRDAEKFDRMIEFARGLPGVRERVTTDLRHTGMPREKVLACAVRLLDQALFRVGSEVYTRSNGSFGLATLRKEHVRVRGDRVVFDFTAKGGKRHVQEVADEDVMATIRTLRRRRNGGGELLAYRDETGWHDIRSGDVNDYIQEVAGGAFSAKDFRTWHATVLAAVFLAMDALELRETTSRRRVVSAAVKEVAAFLGNTSAVARASYIDPRVIDRFEEGVTIAPALERLDDPADPAVREDLEAAVLDLLVPDAAARAA